MKFISKVLIGLSMLAFESYSDELEDPIPTPNGRYSCSNAYANFPTPLDPGRPNRSLPRVQIEVYGDQVTGIMKLTEESDYILLTGVKTSFKWEDFSWGYLPRDRYDHLMLVDFSSANRRFHFVKWKNGLTVGAMYKGEYNYPEFEVSCTESR